MQVTSIFGSQTQVPGVGRESHPNHAQKPTVTGVPLQERGEPQVPVALSRPVTQTPPPEPVREVQAKAPSRDVAPQPQTPAENQSHKRPLPYFMLSGEQKEAVLDILSQYDPYSLSTMDIRDIRLLLKEIHIPQSYQLLSLLQEQGFETEAFTQRPPLPTSQGGHLRADTYAMLLTFSSV